MRGVAGIPATQPLDHRRPFPGAAAERAAVQGLRPQSRNVRPVHVSLRTGARVGPSDLGGRVHRSLLRRGDARRLLLHEMQEEQVRHEAAGALEAAATPDHPSQTVRVQLVGARLENRDSSEIPSREPRPFGDVPELPGNHGFDRASFAIIARRSWFSTLLCYAAA